MSSSPVVTEIGIHRVLAAIDFSPSSFKALNHAIEIARIYGATFYLAHVVSSIGYVMVGADAVVCGRGQRGPAIEGTGAAIVAHRRSRGASSRNVGVPR